ncbi:MAG: MATE family efflux transporter [Oscillospiraceae bacterium]|nr:MATE family efflux transporter [Oscillospiraceae bacterium]
MASATHDLTRGNLYRQIFFFSLPLIFTNLLQILFNMADVAIAGRFAGSHALGAVGSTSTLIFLYTGFLIGLGSGINVLVAQHYGAKSANNVRQVVHTSAILALIAGIVIWIAGALSCRFFLELLGTKPTLIDDAELYMQIYFIGMPAMALYNFGNGVLSAVGDTRRPLMYLGISGAVNILLDLFTVIVLHMDVDGVAIASVTAQYVSAFLILRALWKTKDSYALCPKHLRLSPDKARSVLTMGIPAGIQFAIFSIANLFIQSGVNTFDETVVAGNAAAGNIDNLIYNILAAFYTACSSFIGQNLGAGSKERIRKSYFICLIYSAGAAVLLGGIVLLFGHKILYLFTTEPAVVEAALPRAYIMAISYWLSCFMDNSLSASRGLGRSLVPTAIVILGVCAFRIAWVYTVFAYFGTLTSLYSLFAFSWIITSIAEILYFVRCYKRDLAFLN